MPKNQILTVEELKSLLLVRFKATQKISNELQMRLQNELGTEVNTGDPVAMAINDKFAHWISNVISIRLMQDQDEKPLFSSHDFQQFVSSASEEIERISDREFTDQERKAFERYMMSIFENTKDMLLTFIPSDKNPYEEYWQWVTTVLGLASERRISPVELLASTEATDEITRRTYTRDQFFALTNQAISRLTSLDSLKRIGVLPLLNMIIEEFDEDERDKIKQEIEMELMSQVREMAQHIKKCMIDFYNEELERVYGVV